MAAHGWPAQKAHTARQVARGHAATWACVWSDTCGWPWRKRKILRGEFVPLFIRADFFYFHRVGLCSHTVCLFCRTRGGPRGVGFRLNGGDRVDLSPRDHDQDTCLKNGLK